MAKTVSSSKPARQRPASPEETAVLLRSARRCALCYGVNGDYRAKNGQVAHLNHDPTNSSRKNLVWLCLRHHDLYDSTTRQSKGITQSEVREYRDRLYRHIDQQREAGQPLAAVARTMSHKGATPPASPFAYRKRLAVYKTAKALLAKVYRDARVDDQDLGDFVAGTEEALFLFDADVHAYLLELLAKAVALHSVSIRMEKRDLTDDERRAVSQEDHNLLTWFIDQLAVLRNRLQPFLRVQ